MIETYFLHICNNCKEELKLYHLNWAAIVCQFCKQEIKIKNINSKNTEIVTTIYKNGNRERIN